MTEDVIDKRFFACYDNTMRAWYRRHPLSFIFKELLSFSMLWSAIAIVLPIKFSIAIEVIFLLILMWISYVAAHDEEPFHNDENFEDPWMSDHPAFGIVLHILMGINSIILMVGTPWFQWIALTVLHVGLLMQLHRYWWRCRFLSIRLEKALP